MLTTMNAKLVTCSGRTESTGDFDRIRVIEFRCNLHGMSALEYFQNIEYHNDSVTSNPPVLACEISLTVNRDFMTVYPDFCQKIENGGATIVITTDNVERHNHVIDCIANDGGFKFDPVKKEFIKFTDNERRYWKMTGHAS